MLASYQTRRYLLRKLMVHSCICITYKSLIRQAPLLLFTYRYIRLRSCRESEHSNTVALQPRSRKAVSQRCLGNQTKGTAQC